MARGVDARVLHQAEDLTALVRERQRDHDARLAGAGGTARAVQVVLVVTGRVHVQDQVDAVDVDTAGGDVGRDERVDVAVLEVREDAGAGTLRHAAVQRVGLHAGLDELLGDAVGAQLGADEDDGAALAGGDGGRDRRLVLRLHDEDVVRHGRDVALRAVDLVRDGVGQVALDQGADLVLHGGGEEHALAAAGDLVEQLGDLGQEAQVRHLVGLVEDRDLDVLQGAGAAVDDVAQTAGSGDEDVDTALQGVDLVAHGGTAADDLHLEAEHVAVGLEGVRDLHRELTRRREDDRAGLLLLGVTAGQRGQGRQTEGEGLAGAGAATAEDVLAGQGVRDGRGLDREGGGDAVLGELAHDPLGQTEVAEGDGGLRVGGAVLEVVGGLVGRHVGLKSLDDLVRLSGLNGLGDRKGLGIGDELVRVVLGHDGTVRTGNGHAKCETFRSLGTRPNSVNRKSTASMRSATARESTRHTALFGFGAGQWDQTIYNHTHPPGGLASHPGHNGPDLRRRLPPESSGLSPESAQRARSACGGPPGSVLGFVSGGVGTGVGSVTGGGSWVGGAVGGVGAVPPGPPDPPEPPEPPAPPEPPPAEAPPPDEGCW
nr:hypothetical protein [Streptomyces sp. ADI95-16]